MNLKRLFSTIGFSLHMTSAGRGDYARRKGIFRSVGKDVRLPAMNLPLYPEMITFHNNIEVATGVLFVTHDAIHEVVNRDGRSVDLLTENKDSIEIMDNVFIGAGTIILPGVKIGPNAIIGAGSLVNKDIPPGSVCAGNPAKQIGTYDGYVRSRLKKSAGDTEDKENG